MYDNFTFCVVWSMVTLNMTLFSYFVNIKYLLLGLRETVGYLMSRWERTMERRFCELVGNYLLYDLSKLYEKKDLGLYRDDEMAFFKYKSGSES